MALSVDTTPAKHVTVLKNGDNKYEGRKFVVSRRRYRTFDSLLSDITHQISAPFGAVRRLYTPKGSRQIRGIDDLEGGGTYIASGSEKFKKLNYNPVQSPLKNWGISKIVKPGFLADDPPPLILPKKNKKYAQRSAQFHKVRQPVQFTVFRNGLPSDKGTKFLLKSREMKSFETVLSIISFKIRLVEGAVRRLHSVEGSILTGPGDITDGGHYVACGHRRFILAPYGEIASKPANANQKLPSIKKRRDPTHPSPRTQSNPLPAIRTKGDDKKARSEKDSPAPFEEDKEVEAEGLNVNDKESTIPDMVTDGDAGEDLQEDISRTEVNTVTKSKSQGRRMSTQAVSSEEIKNVPSKSKLDRNPPKKKSNPELLTNTDDAVFNATDGSKPVKTEGQFLMDNSMTNGNKNGNADEIEEDTNLIEDKPIDLQNAEEVPEYSGTS